MAVNKVVYNTANGPEVLMDITDSTVTSDKMLSGVVAYGADGKKISGSISNNGSVSTTLNTSVTSYTIPKGYHSGSGKVSITTETKTVTPTKSSQSVTPTTGKVLSNVTVSAIPSNYVDITTYANAETSSF